MPGFFVSSTGYIIIKTKNRKEIGTELSWPFSRLPLVASFIHKSIGIL